MSVAIAPSLFKTCFTAFKTLQRIFHALVWLSCCTINIQQIFCAFVHKPVCSTASCCAIVLAGIAHNVCCAVGHVYRCAVGCTEHSFCLSVAVPVVCNNVLLVVLEVAHVRTAVHPPQHRTVLLQTLEQRIFAIVSSARITCINLALIVVFQQNFDLAVAIYIGTAGIVRNICRLKRGIVLWLNLLPSICQYSDSLARSLLFSTHNSLNGVCAACRTAGIGIV